METLVNVFYGSRTSPAFIFDSIEDAVKGLRKAYAEKPFTVYSIRFYDERTVKYRKEVVNRFGKSAYVPYEVHTRYLKIKIVDGRNHVFVSATPGSQWLQVDPYFKGENLNFAGYSSIEFFSTIGGHTYSSPLRYVIVNHFSPSYSTQHDVNGVGGIIPILEKVRKEGKLHIHHYDRFSDDLVPSVDAE